MIKLRYPSGPFIEGPFIELGFYFSSKRDLELFHQFVLLLLEKGAKLSGIGYIHRGKGIRDIPFASIHDHDLEEVSIFDKADLDRYYHDRDIRLVEVDLHQALGLQMDAFEIATLVGNSQEASVRDSHPIVLWADGSTFSIPDRAVNGAREERTRQGKIIYEYFRSIVDDLRPSYAAITSEEALECPTDLRKDHKSLAFKDFYISVDYIGENNLRLIREEFSQAYIEPMADGIYISTYKYMNPENIGLDSHVSSEKSFLVARLIGELKGKD
jgi:hypothetical protein